LEVQGTKEIDLDSRRRLVIHKHHLPDLWRMAQLTDLYLRCVALQNALALLRLCPERRNFRGIPKDRLEFRFTMESQEVNIIVKLRLLIASHQFFPITYAIEQELGSINQKRRWDVAKACAEADFVPLLLAKFFLAETDDQRSLIRGDAIKAAANNRWLAKQTI